MIDKCKFAMKFLCRLVVGAGSFMWRFEITEKNIFSVQHNPCPVEGVTFVPTDSLETAFIIGVFFYVVQILCVTTFSKIRFPVIECVMVAVVADLLSEWLHDESVHVNNFTFLRNRIPFVAASIEAISGVAPHRKPRPFREFSEVLGIDNSVLALRESNEPVGWIKRLGNRVPWQRRSGHVLTSNENVFLSRYFSMVGA